jgi:lipopolysaccharide biosynthesis glycosyltransferase
MLVIKPHEAFFTQLEESVVPAINRKSGGGLSTGDQDVFKEAFPDWYQHKELILPETYNCLYGMLNSVCRKEKCSPKELMIVHFAGKKKPWDCSSTYVVRIGLSILKHHEDFHNFCWKLRIWQKYWRYCQPEK